MSAFRLLAAAAVLTATAGSSFAAQVSASAAHKPRWVAHVERFKGGISNGVRFSLDLGLARVLAPQAGNAQRHPHPSPGHNVQMNDDTFPEVPQNEESVAYSTDDPRIAVAAANDYVSGGVVVMRTRDGGRHWESIRVVPQFVPNRDFCSGGDPGVAYSARDHAFYLSQLCFFRAAAPSEVHVFKSLDNGATWTPGRFAAVAATNVTNPTPPGTVDD